MPVEPWKGFEGVPEADPQGVWPLHVYEPGTSGRVYMGRGGEGGIGGGAGSGGSVGGSKEGGGWLQVVCQFSQEAKQCSLTLHQLTPERSQPHSGRAQTVQCVVDGGIGDETGIGRALDGGAGGGELAGEGSGDRTGDGDGGGDETGDGDEAGGGEDEGGGVAIGLALQRVIQPWYAA